MKEELTSKEKLANKLYIPLRILSVISVVLLFFPQVNPAAFISKAGEAVVSDTASLFTCGISYKALTPRGLPRAFRMGWLNESYFSILFVCCLLLLLGVIAIAAGSCISLGNLKLKKLGAKISTIGSGVYLLATIGQLVSYFLISGSADPDRITVNFKPATIIFIAIAAISLVMSFIIMKALPAPKKGEKFYMESKYKLFLMLLPFLFLTFAFSYLPLASWVYAFVDYKSGQGIDWSTFGFQNFKMLFQSTAYVRRIFTVLRNTLAMSGLGLLTSWVPMAFAIFLTEIKNSKYRRFVQTFTTIPNFISWVLVYAIAFAIFNTDGFINTMINSITGGSGADTNYLGGNSHMWLKMLLWGTWKGVGWSAIIYISGIAGIDQQLYEAATVDGAGRFQRMWHITLPGLLPTYVVMLIMSIAGILSNGMDQYLVFTNAQNKYTIEVLDLYVYNLGIGDGSISLSTVVGMTKSIVSVVLLFVANKVAKLVRGENIV